MAYLLRCVFQNLEMVCYLGANLVLRFGQLFPVPQVVLPVGQRPVLLLQIASLVRVPSPTPHASAEIRGQLLLIRLLQLAQRNRLDRMVNANWWVPARVVLFENGSGEIVVCRVVGDEGCAARVEGEACITQSEVRYASADQAEAYAEEALRGWELLELRRGRDGVHLAEQLRVCGRERPWRESAMGAWAM